MQKSKDSLKACFENVNIRLYAACSVHSEKKISGQNIVKIKVNIYLYMQHLSNSIIEFFGVLDWNSREISKADLSVEL